MEAWEVRETCGFDQKSRQFHECTFKQRESGREDMQLAEIHRYPVKSMLGEQLQQAEVGPNGILGDRAWALKDERRGELTGAKRFAALMDMRAQFTGTPTASHPSATVEIRARDRRLRSSDGDVNASLSELLDHPVSL